MQVKITIKRKQPWQLLLVSACLIGICALIFVLRWIIYSARAADTITFKSDVDFRILEIVPYHGMGEVGYLVDGEEPVDLKKLSTDYYQVCGDMQQLFCIGQGADALYEWDADHYKKLYLEDGESYDLYQRAYTTCEEYPDETITTSGYFKRVVNRGLYSKYSVRKQDGTYEDVYRTDDSWNANYIWVNCARENYMPSGLSPEQPGYTVFYDSYTRNVAYYYRGGYVNLDAFKRMVLRLDEDEIEHFKVDVLTLTPDEVNKYPELINETDFVYIFPKCHNTVYLRFYEKYGWDIDKETFHFTDGGDFPDFYQTYSNSSKSAKKPNDLSWEVVSNIVKQIALNQMALFMDGTVYSSYNGYWKQDVKKPDLSGGASGTSNNVAKLFLMVMQRPILDFYNLFLSPTSANPLTGYTDAQHPISTGYFNSPNGRLDTAIYWNQNTFLPSSIGLTEAEFKQKLNDAGINNEWVTGGNALLSAHSTMASSNGGFGINENLLTDWITGQPDSGWNNQEVIDYVQERDNLTTPPTSVKGRDVLNYIIHPRVNTKKFLKNEIKILDLEPCMDQTLTIDKVKEWTGGEFEDDKITIVPMSTAELNGKMENLAEVYDLVYCGLGTATMNLDAQGHTVYNQESLNGLIYLHIGDVMKAGPKLSGLFKTGSGEEQDYKYDHLHFDNAIKGYSYLDEFTNPYQHQVGNFRYSGNDITKLKQKELEEYIDKGYPMIVADNFYTSEQDAMNDDTIDNSSYIYELLDQNRPAYHSNLLQESNVTPDKLEPLLNIQKVKLEITGKAEDQTWPEEYRYTGEASSQKAYLTKTGTKNLLKYQFKLSGIAGITDTSTFNVQLYLDQDGDGAFCENEKCAVKITDGGTRETANGGKYQLDLGKTYLLSYEVSEDYNGFLPYQIKVHQNVDTVPAVTSYIGYTAIKAATKQKVRVLQVVGGNNFRNNSDYQNVDKYLDLSVAGSQDFEGNLLYPYLADLDDYDFEFVTITVEELRYLYVTGKRDFDAYWRNRQSILEKIGFTPVIARAGYNGTYQQCDGTKETSRIESFDLIIFGFGENENEIDVSDFYSDLDYFLTDRSMLVSNDTISYIQSEQDHYFRTEQIRLWDDLTIGCYELEADFWGYEFGRHYRNLIGMDRYGASHLWNSSIDVSGKDQPYTANQFRSSQEKEIQGFTYMTLNANAVGRLVRDLVEHTITKYSNLKNVNVSQLWPECMRSYVPLENKSNEITKLNRGAITNYPYVIDDELGISNSHSGYYQLDLESHKDSENITDLHVWYCLSDDGSGNRCYSASHNDAANNYYLYTKGNITYTGLGHSKLVSKEEAKLFVNTLVASCRKYVRPDPGVKIEVPDEIELTQTEYYAYIDADVNQIYDDALVCEPTNERYYRKINFMVTCGENRSANMVITDETGTVLTLYDTAGQPVTGSIQTNTDYCVYVKKAYVNNKPVHLTLECEEKQATVTVLRRIMFHLD